MAHGDQPPVADPDRAPEEHPIHIPDLPLGIRLVLLMLGWLVVILGLAGLLLPGLQGILLIVIGAAILSVASDTVHRLLEKLLAKRPHIRERFNNLRHRVRSRLSRHR